MSFFREHRHATAFLFALTFVAVSAKGLCLMPAAGGAKGDAHDCCAKGWRTAPPGCCMAGAAGEDPARTVVSATLSAPPAMIDAVPPPPPATRAHAALAAGTRSHSPPGLRPLRI